MQDTNADINSTQNSATFSSPRNIKRNTDYVPHDSISQIENHENSSATKISVNDMQKYSSSNAFKTKNCSSLITLRHYYAKASKSYCFMNEKASHYWRILTDNDRIFHYAASLSFYSIFSIIPAFLMLFSIVSLFPSFQDQMQILKQSILDSILPANTNEVARILDNFLSNGKEMGFVGFLISLISSFIFFRNFDDVAARIFDAKKRSYFDSFIIYWLLITLMPLFLATSMYFNTMIMTMYSDIFITKFYACIPMLATWLIFVILFRVAANKPLRLFVLTLASLLGSFVWYWLKILFFYYMGYNKFYSNIYGSVSFVMFVFLWIYVSWIVVLFSMQFCKWLDTKYPCTAAQ